MRNFQPLLAISAGLIGMSCSAWTPFPSASVSLFESKLGQRILNSGLAGRPTLESALRKDLTELAAQGGAQVVADELAKVGAECVERAGKHHCQIEKSLTIKSLGIFFFPQYEKILWHISVSYDQHGNAVSNINVKFETERI